jgi:hypothetical protein
MIGWLQRPTEIVHREDVFKKLGLLKITNAASLARRIKFVSERVGSHVEIVIIF